MNKVEKNMRERKRVKPLNNHFMALPNRRIPCADEQAKTNKYLRQQRNT